ncbi:MAG: cytidine deaminase [Acidobacteriota bacterium]
MAQAEPRPTIDWKALIERARDARERSYSPYSRFAVGAALVTDDGTVFSGCNVENRTFGLCVCAERVAVTRAVADGHRSFAALAVVTDTSPPAVPCGLCLETLSEFARDLPIAVANLASVERRYRLRELFPQPFEWPSELALDA